MALCMNVALAAPSDTPPKVLWQVVGQGWAGASAVVGGGGEVFLADAKGVAYRVDPLSGKVLWKYDLDDRLLYTPALSKGVLYFGRVGELAAVQLNGDKRWTKPIDDSPVLSPAIGRDGTIYAAGGPDFYAVTPGNKVLWAHKTKAFYGGAPVVAADGTVYVGAGNILLALDAGGKLRWQYQAGSTLYANPAIDAAGNLYLGTGSGLVSLGSSGKLRWQRRGAAMTSTPVVGADGRVYTTDQSGRLSAVSREGKTLWSFHLADSIGGSPALAEGLLYVGASDGRLHAVDLTGRERWSVPLDGAVFGSPVIGPDGHVYVGAGKTFYALATTAPLAAAPWPLARQNPAGEGRAPRVRRDR